jgi:hypothetical protein
VVTGRVRILPAFGQGGQQRADPLAMSKLPLSIDLKSGSVAVSLRHACLRVSDFGGGRVTASGGRRDDLLAIVRRSTRRHTSCISNSCRHPDSLKLSSWQSNGNSDTSGAW